MRKFIYILIFLSMVFIFTTITIAADKVVSGLTIEAAQAQALENNKQSAIDDLEIKAKETALKIANEDAAMLGDAYGADNVLNNQIIRYVRTMEAASNLEAAMKIKQDNISKLKVDVYTIILDIVLTGKEAEKEALKLEIVAEKLNMAKVRFSTKTITEDDLKAAEYDYESKKLDVGSVQDTLYTLDLQLKRLLNLPFSGDMLKVDAKLGLSNFSEADIDKILEASLLTDTGIYIKNAAYLAAEKTMGHTAKLYKEGETTYDDNKVKLEDAKLDCEDAKKNLEVNIRNTYNDLLNLRDKQELALRYEALMKKKLDSADLKHKKGLISRSEYLNAKEGWIDAVYLNYKAIRDFNAKNAQWLDLAR